MPGEFFTIVSMIFLCETSLNFKFNSSLVTFQTSKQIFIFLVLEIGSISWDLPVFTVWPTRSQFYELRRDETRGSCPKMCDHLYMTVITVWSPVSFKQLQFYHVIVIKLKAYSDGTGTFFWRTLFRQTYIWWTFVRRTYFQPVMRQMKICSAV